MQYPFIHTLPTGFSLKFEQKLPLTLRTDCALPLYLSLDVVPYFYGAERSRRQCQLEAKLQHHIKKFLADEAGATAIEYGLIAAGISLAIIAIVNSLGSNLNGMFTSINSSLK